MSEERDKAATSPFKMIPSDAELAEKLKIFLQSHPEATLPDATIEGLNPSMGATCCCAVFADGQTADICTPNIKNKKACDEWYDENFGDIPGSGRFYNKPCPKHAEGGKPTPRFIEVE